MRALLAAVAATASLAVPAAASPQDCLMTYLGAGYTIRPPRYGIQPHYLDITPTAYSVKEFHTEARDFVACAT